MRKGTFAACEASTKTFTSGRRVHQSSVQPHVLTSLLDSKLDEEVNWHLLICILCICSMCFNKYVQQ